MALVKNNKIERFKVNFSARNRFARSLWSLIYLLFFRFSHRLFHPWRILILRCFGAKIGRGCRIYPSVSLWAPWNLICGNFVGIGDNVRIYNQAPVFICDEVTISEGSYLCTGTHDYKSPDFVLITKSINIGKKAWLCAQTFILPGITIGEEAVIGARAVVTRDMPPRMICAGNPCAPIKNRETSERTDFSSIPY